MNNIKEFFLYDLQLYKVQDFFYNLKWFCKNLKSFSKQLWYYRDWDHCYAVDMYVYCLEQLANSIENGHEEERSALKKAAKIRELTNLLQYDIDEDILNVYKIMKDKGIDDSALIDKECNKAYHDYCKKIFSIIEGQNTHSLSERVSKSLKKKFPDKENFSSDEWYDEWVEHFDGSGSSGWWD